MRASSSRTRPQVRLLLLQRHSQINSKHSPADFEIQESTALTPLPIRDLPLPSRISVGEYIAEDELPDLGSYTSSKTHQSRSLLDGGFKIIVGRKGTGKSALAHITHDKLQEQERTAVRVITPKGYELKQVLDIAKRSGLPMGGPVVGALWQYANRHRGSGGPLESNRSTNSWRPPVV